MRLLLTGAGGSAAANFLDAARLAQADLYVVAADANPRMLELVTADAYYQLPSVSDPTYLDALNRIVEHERIDVVHPQPDPEVLFLSSAAQVVNASTFLPPHEVVALCQDKLHCHARLVARGCAAPRASGVTDEASLAAAVQETVSRSGRAWLRAIRGAGARASLPVQSTAQAQQWVDYWRGFAGLEHDDFMVSDFLPGREYAWQSVWWNGELVCGQARERVEYLGGGLTPSGQSSSPSVARTVDRPDVDETGYAAVTAVTERPHGVFCVDMKCDRDDTARVTEINAGRFFTTSNFFARAGLNMPSLYLDLAMGNLPPAGPTQMSPLPAGLWWIRNTDMGYALVREGEWRARTL